MHVTLRKAWEKEINGRNCAQEDMCPYTEEEKMDA